MASTTLRILGIDVHLLHLHPGSHEEKKDAVCTEDGHRIAQPHVADPRLEEKKGNAKSGQPRKDEHDAQRHSRKAAAAQIFGESSDGAAGRLVSESLMGME